MIPPEGSGGPCPQADPPSGWIDHSPKFRRREQEDHGVSDQIQEKEPRKSRRALLTAALGAGAAVAAQAALPLAAQAHDADDIESGVTNVDVTTTGIDTSATADVDAFAAEAGGTGAALVGTAADGQAVKAANTNVVQAAAYVTSGDTTFAVVSTDTLATGLYGWTPASTDYDVAIGKGVWGDSSDIGVYGSGGIGMEGDGFGVGGIGLLGYADTTSGIGVWAYAPATNQYALKVSGKVSFSNAGRSIIGAGKSSLTVSKAGVTSSSRVFAQLAANRPGRYVRAVVASSGKFTIYLNTTVTSATYVIWWILN
jgi:hypothetical protein